MLLSPCKTANVLLSIQATEGAANECSFHDAQIIRVCGMLRTFFFPPLISLIADGPHHYHPACGHISHLSPVHALRFFIAMQVSTLTTRQPMVEFYLLPRFPVRKKEHKSYFGKNRTLEFRTSRCAGYLLDHSGDELRILYF